ncbi:PAS domain S-box-containing protein/diguanylate cyclase (GGDEF) domain-containing protein [Poseidonocella pacifica]|uniref:PAS domain S-box-containing protein/diguanylate cyclase (GGDEF) domain-containing protein n=1 Tax=Poseidonocella pacifica TaxID=871651 RepID=A0A1I0WRK8_9RHOB|nr:sensor domain-containing phosphodiesterase [Poseidonocella pacifica]SFA90780.1 PAS domain S-box-containing protein/diguanylate cyclase (GGDEF) domain-containing protein [Poseidonocella pacifica]
MRESYGSTTASRGLRHRLMRWFGRSTEARVHPSRQTLRGIMEISPSPLLLVSANGRILELSPSAADLLESDTLAGTDIDKLIAPEDLPAFRQLCRANRQSGAPAKLRTVLADAFPVEIAVTPLRISTHTGLREAYLLGLTNISEVEVLRSALEYRVNHDPLTGLLSRQGFLRRVHAAHQAGELGLVLLDVDHFKTVNDNFGHDTGDALLLAVAEALRSAIGANCAAGRLGGEEFGIVFPCREDSELIDFAQKVRKTVRRASVACGTRRISRTCSLGAILPPSDMSVEQAVTLADAAMLEAKSIGRDRAILADDAFIESHDARGGGISMEEIREAINSGAIRNYLQPIVDVETREIAGFEALVRWEKCDGSLILPDKFLGKFLSLTHAEEGVSLLRRLRMQVMETLTIAPGAYVAFNVELDSLAVPGAAAQLAESFGPYCGGDRPIVLEISERAFNERLDLKTVLSELEKLRSTGFRLALDDFGAASSNIARLLDFPVDIVKLDKLLINDLLNESTTRKPLFPIAMMCSWLNVRIVAEGVEEQAQLELLQSARITHQQGFLFSPPRPVEEINAIKLTIGTDPEAKSADVRIPESTAAAGMLDDELAELDQIGQ